MFRTLKQTLIRLGNQFSSTKPHVPGKAHAFRPALMILEQRDCPATAAFSAGALVVQGADPRGEQIQVVTQGADMVVMDGQQEIFRQTANTVTQLSVTTGAGNDTVTIHLTETGGVLAPSLKVNIDTGAGDDQVNCTCENVATAINATVNLGAGNDRLVGTSINQAPTGVDVEHINGGAGDDQIACIQINPAGTVNTVMDGGSGNDVLFGHLIDSQATANLSFNAIGGLGDDTINLLAEGNVNGQLAFDIQGDAGADQIGLTFNLADPITPGSLPPSTVAIQGSVDCGQGDDVVTVDPGNPYNLAQVQFPQLMQFNGGSGMDTVVVAEGIPLNMLPINAVNFEVV
jgi:hypothetical protein